jgi:hypothetical protein
MANLVRKIETTLSFGLVVGAALAFTIWHEPGCGTLLTYFAVRGAVYGTRGKTCSLGYAPFAAPRR